MSGDTSTEYSQACLDEFFSQYDMIKNHKVRNQRAFSGDLKKLHSTQPKGNSVFRSNDIWYADPSGKLTTSDIRSCIISIRTWYAHRSASGLPPLITDHKCTIYCHKNACKSSPTIIHKKPLIYGCELSGILHYCNDRSPCEWTDKDPKTCSRRCVFAITKCVGEWATPVDISYFNYHKARDREEAEYGDGYCNNDEEMDFVNEFDESSCFDYPEIAGVASQYEKLEGKRDYDSPESSLSWDDDSRNDSTRGGGGGNINEDDGIPIDYYDSHRRMHKVIFGSIERQKSCNTYDPIRVKRRKRAKERLKKSETTNAYDAIQSCMGSNRTCVYLIESGIKGDCFYICTPKGDMLGNLLGGKEIPKEEFYEGGIDPECASDFDSLISDSLSSVKKPLETNKAIPSDSNDTKSSHKNEEKDSMRKRRRSLLTVDQMEKLDEQVLNSEEFVKKFKEMSISLRIPIGRANGTIKRRGPTKGYKKRFSTKVETIKGEDMGIIGFNDRYKVGGLPAFSSSESMQSFIEREKKELGYNDLDKETSESLEKYSIYDIIRDKVVAELNRNVPGYLPKKERYKLKKRREAGIITEEEIKGKDQHLFKHPTIRGNKIPQSYNLSLSSPSLTCGTPNTSLSSHLSSPCGMTPKRNKFGLSHSANGPISFGGSRNTPSSSVRRSPLVFGISVGSNGQKSSCSPSMMILNGSTPSRSNTPMGNSFYYENEYIMRGGNKKDITAMRKWPVGKTIRDQSRVADMVAEKVNRVIIDLLVDRGPRRSIAKIKKLSMIDDFHNKARQMFNKHASFKKEDGTKVPLLVNYHKLLALWKSVCKPVVEKKPPEFSVERQLEIKEIIVKCWMLLSRKEYSEKRNKKKASLFSFIVGMLYLMAYGGYTSEYGVVVLQQDKWLSEHLPTLEDMDVLNKRKIGSKSNRGFSCKGDIVSKSNSVAALSPNSIRTFGQGSNRAYSRKTIGEGIILAKFLLKQYEEIGPGDMQQVKCYLSGTEVIDNLIVKNPFTQS